ncbi:MAG: acyl-CoA dehydratase activase-related protein [Bacteroidales bacterium]|jgi:predicted CoA-substrate-specific enzyme activase|nr:acyl-CoA dehydratase activase-related protein [Bacteroidales bacterium]
MKLGIDIGSTSIKCVLIDDGGKALFQGYKRHHAAIIPVLRDLLLELDQAVPHASMQVMFTGSIGMGIAERLQLPFNQEVISSIKYVQLKHPEVKTFIDIGGEDAKLIFFQPNLQPDIRMNGSCAGGTGAFIDQMASLLGIPMEELNQYAEKAETIYPIASRCGVFSKTDIQNLVARNANKSDIVASIFHAIALQVISSLSRGYNVIPQVIFCGAPFAFLPELSKAFLKLLQLTDSDIVANEDPELVPAYGTALSIQETVPISTMHNLLEELTRIESVQWLADVSSLPSLFKSEEEFEQWQKSKIQAPIKKIKLEDNEEDRLFLGVDSGSTTTKIVVMNSRDEIIFDYYAKNQGDALLTFREGISIFKQQCDALGRKVSFKGSTVTGYGETLLKAAYNMHFGIVETMAHYFAAAHISPQVSFILDIGGQDMKAIFVENDAINRIEINEACSSGCGSFIDGFASMLGMNVADFAHTACTSQHPADLGTRCTVFMNSKVKQMLRQGTPIEDIAGGLSFSIIKNCLFKVLKLKNVSELGENIVVQGGTFKNLSVLRALELLIDKEVTVSNIPELMGAYGAALYARRNSDVNSAVNNDIDIDKFLELKSFDAVNIQCKGCENRCNIKKMVFSNQQVYYAGNKCDNVYSNLDTGTQRGDNFHAIKYDKLFKRSTELKKPLFRMGIPRGLIFYEDYPFWHTLLTACNIEPVLSGTTTVAQYEKGVKTIMADNICFPAKLMHGHVMYLIKKNVDRILYPYIVYERKEDKGAVNSFNCPIVSGYSDVMKSAIETEEQYGIPLDAPVLNFNNKKLLTKSLLNYFSQFNIDKQVITEAIEKAIAEQNAYEQWLCVTNLELYEKSLKEDKPVVMLAGRPYHIDPLIQHKISDAIAAFGVTVINEDIVRYADKTNFEHTQTVTQWAFPNRIMNAAKWVAAQGTNVHFVQLTSFGCGPDAFLNEDIKQILHQQGKNLTLLKVDDVNNIGSLKLRIRSLLEYSKNGQRQESVEMKRTPTFEKKDKFRTIIAPYFAEGYSEMLPSLFKLMDIELINLPPSNLESNDIGLQYANNEICYPATLVVGDVIKALKSGLYNLDEVAVAITQTGGQCRATNYISVIKKAMISAGFENIPVVSVSFGKGLLNDQPGFDLKWSRCIVSALHVLHYVDALSKLYYPAAAREKERGAARVIREKYMDLGKKCLENREKEKLTKLLDEAIDEFNAVIDHSLQPPQIGVVGEIYVKYNSFSHKNVVDWLVEQGVEVAAPSLYNFFMCEFINMHVKKELHIDKLSIPLFISDFAFGLVKKITKKYDNACARFPYYRPFSDLLTDSHNASRIINLAAQFGEGWLIPAEIAGFAEGGIENAISLQPFGCIANHVISKGIEKKIKKTYPKMNLLFLDFDGGTSEANVLNRLHFMLDNCKNTGKGQ